MAVLIKYAIYKQNGPPKQRPQPDSDEYQMEGDIDSLLTAREARLQEKAMFMLATNNGNEALTMEIYWHFTSYSKA
jgi:hypothetical protein